MQLKLLQKIGKVAFDAGVRKVNVYVKGPGNGREAAIRAIYNVGISVSEIVDVTPLPHMDVDHLKKTSINLK